MINKRLSLHYHIIHVLEADGMKFGQDPHSLSVSQAEELHEWSTAMHFRPSTRNSLSKGRQYYVFLSKLA